jgi:glucan-binding YG repeat protein
MVYGGTYSINGEDHKFSYDGVWLGQVYEEPEIEVEVADGWKYENGGWRYYVANECLRAKSILYNGKRYAFNYDGYMVTDCFYGSCYYDANGERVNYVGWHYINGGWAYFNDAYVAQSGWVNDGKALYYITARYDDNTEKTVGFDLATGIVNVNTGGFYYFDSEGRLCEKITKDGWHLFDGDWYYYQNGEGVNNRSLRIDGKDYAFAYGGKMVSDRIFNGCYYLKSGEKATQGWYWTKNEYDQYGWTYVLENGKVANGVHVIDGVEYGFKYGIWVE